MISDCSSLLNRLDRSPPASTLLIYSRKPCKIQNCINMQNIYGGETAISPGRIISSETHLFFDILVSEEESGSSTWTTHYSSQLYIAIVYKPVVPVVLNKVLRSSRKFCALYVLKRVHIIKGIGYLMH